MNNDMQKVLIILKMLVKAPTLYVYAVFKWVMNINSHKVFICCSIQTLLLAITLVLYLVQNKQTAKAKDICE